MEIEFRLLGSIEAYHAGQRVDLGHARQRAVLVVLLVEANQVVSIDQLVDRVWGERAPHKVRNTLYGYLHRLRRALDGASGVEITRRPGGYVLSVDRLAVDMHRFTFLIGQADGTEDEEASLALLDQALGLWRGTPFAGVDTPWLNDLRDQLDQRRLATELDLVDLALRHGRHADWLSRLAAHVETRPLDERLAGQYMLVLCRMGRQGDALEHYERTRRRLADELAIDPGPALRLLHQQIISADPELDAPRATPSRPTPRQLPPPPWSFTGRGNEFALLSKTLDLDTTVITTIAGGGGTGKTWLALHWAHENLGRFPDGQLFVDLRGFDPTEAPLAPQAALRGFLDALGVAPAAIPLDTQAQIGMYRSLVADRRVLIVLDNARDTAQVLPLLPGDPKCAVLITSRSRLSNLTVSHGAQSVPLDVLDDVDARQLLTRHLGGERLAAEPGAATELLTRCAGLPLALGVVAARALAHPEFPLAVLAEELRDEASRLDALDSGESTTGLRTVLSWSLHALSDEAARSFALLGLAPGPDISTQAAASLIGVPVTRARVLLRELEHASLLQQHQPGRHRMHDLIRLYAADHVRREFGEADILASLRRAVDFALHTAYTAERLLAPNRPPVELDSPAPGCRPLPPADYATALTWFEADHANLLASQRTAVALGWHRSAWQLAWAPTSFHYRRGHVHDQLATWRTGLAAADQLTDPAARILAHQHLGHACSDVGLHSEAIGHLHQALALAEDPATQAHIHHTLGWAWEQQGDDQQALEHATHALELLRNHGKPGGEADALNAVGWYAARTGDYERGRAECERALAMHRDRDDAEGEATTLDSLGYIATRAGRLAEAIEYYRQALALHRVLDNAYQVANTLERVGHTYQAHGLAEQAAAAWQEALELCRRQHRTAEAEQIEGHLATLESRP